MLAQSRRKFAALAFTAGLLAALPAIAQTPSAANDKDVAAALRAGGLVIVVRHGATFPDQADTDPFNFDNVAAQRNLNGDGKALARAFGAAFRQLGIPVGSVYTSKFNRAYETATLAGFENVEKTADLTEGGLVVSPNENSRRAEARHQHHSDHAQAEHHRRARQGLVRREGRRGFDLPSRTRPLHAHRPGANVRLVADRRGGELDSS